MLRLAGPRVALRPLRADELDRLCELRRARSTGSGDVAVLQEELAERIAHSGGWFEGRLELAVDVDGELVGTIDARAPQGFYPAGVCELGIELFTGRRGQGVGSEAVQLLVEWLFENGYPRVQASTDLRNGPMRRVLEKLGFEQEGVLRGFMPDGDTRADYALYAAIRQ